MRKVYTVVDDFVLNNTRILALSDERDPADFDTHRVIIDDAEYSYDLTHNEHWITIRNADEANQFIGKTLTFE